MSGRGWAAQARRVAFTVALTAAAFVASARAQPAGNTNRSDAEWLQAIQSAAQRINYSGTIYYQQGADVRVSRIVHQFDGSVSRERLQILGERREYLREGDEVQCLLPDSKRVVVERRPIGGSFPALSSASPADILRSYNLRKGPIDRVADRECQVLLLEPKDGARYGYRLWVERTTGLLLRAQMLNDRQEVIEQMAFTDVQIGERPDPARVQPGWSTDGWRVDKVETRQIDITRAWTVVVPDGFRLANSVARRFGRDASRDTMQAVYSDGLATFSVFIEPDSGAPASASRSKGAINAFVQRIGDTIVTVVGEVPPDTVRGVALSVKARSAR